MLCIVSTQKYYLPEQFCGAQDYHQIMFLQFSDIPGFCRDCFLTPHQYSELKRWICCTVRHPHCLVCMIRLWKSILSHNICHLAAGNQFVWDFRWLRTGSKVVLSAYASRALHGKSAGPLLEKCFLSCCNSSPIIQPASSLNTGVCSH